MPLMYPPEVSEPAYVFESLTLPASAPSPTFTSTWTFTVHAFPMMLSMKMDPIEYFDPATDGVIVTVSVLALATEDDVSLVIVSTSLGVDPVLDGYDAIAETERSSGLRKAFSSILNGFIVVASSSESR